MPEINPQVQNLIDAVTQRLDELPIEERKSTIEHIRNILSQKYYDASAGVDAEMATDEKSNADSNAKKKPVKRRRAPKKVVIRNDSSKPVHSEIEIPFVENDANEMLRFHFTNPDDAARPESPQYVNVVVVDLKTEDNFPKTEILKQPRATKTKRMKKELIPKIMGASKGTELKAEGTKKKAKPRTKRTKKKIKEYFIEYPTTDKSSTDTLSEEKCLEMAPKMTKEVNVHIHCQEPPAQSIKKKPSSSTKLRRCSVCDFVSDQLLEFIVHMRQHNEPKLFTCSTCGKTFHQASGLKSHEKRHTGIRDFECDYCSFKSYTKADMSRHMTQHKPTQQFVCHYCGKLFSLESTLRVHLRTIHERDQKYPCDQCNFSTFHKPNLRVHVQVHHTDGSAVYKMTCPICHIRIKQKSTYIDHMRSHTGERPFRCEQCGRNFACLGRLNAHIKTVHAPRLFPCTECTKTFQSTHHLQRHLLIHTKEKPYKCPNCKHASNTQGNLKKHMKDTHHIINFSCRKSKQVVTELDETTRERSIQKGQIATEEYLAALSAKSGKTVTLEELKKQEEEKLNNPKPKVISKKEQEKNEKRAKFEHSYHLVDLLPNSTEGNLDMPTLGVDPITKSEYPTTDEPSATSPTQMKQDVCMDEGSGGTKPTTITLLSDDASKNIYRDLTGNSNSAEQSILYGEIAEELYIDDETGTESIHNMEDQYTLYEVNDSNEALSHSDYTISLSNPETQLSTADDIILMINDGNILIIGE